MYFGPQTAKNGTRVLTHPTGGHQTGYCRASSFHSKGLFPLWLRCALRAIVNDIERYVAMSRYISFTIVHSRLQRAAQRSCSAAVVEILFNAQSYSFIGEFVND